MELIAGLGWLLALVAGGLWWKGQAELGEARKQLEDRSQELDSIRSRSTELVKEADATVARVKRHAEEQRRYASDGLLRDIVPVVDDLGRALASAASDGLKEGVDMVRARFLQQLARHGVQPVQAVGQPFDPRLHEAVEQELTDEVDPGTVVAEWEAGYLLHDRLLRPAKVVVASPAPDPITDDVEE